MQSKRTPASVIALGGILAALAVVVMALGTLIPVATYVCPVLCCMLLQTVLKCCGRRIAWAWYGTVAILCVLLAPDKEAAAVFVFVGYYPIVKPRLDKCRASWLWKGLLFNSVILMMYALLIRLLGMDEIAAEYREMGYIMTAVMLILGNAVFFLLDRLLGMGFQRINPGRK